MSTFIVFAPDGEGAPTRVHETHKAATYEAWRLAKLHPGRAFLVMRQASQRITVEVPMSDPAPTNKEQSQCQ